MESCVYTNTMEGWDGYNSRLVASNLTNEHLVAASSTQSGVLLVIGPAIKNDIYLVFRSKTSIDIDLMVLPITHVSLSSGGGVTMGRDAKGVTRRHDETKPLNDAFPLLRDPNSDSLPEARSGDCEPTPPCYWGHAA